MTPSRYPAVGLRQVDDEVSRRIVEGPRPEYGWASDFPTDGDVAVTSYWRERASEEVAPWSSPWLIVEDDVVVGMLGFKGAPKDGEIDVGYGVAPSARGRGVATAALALLLDVVKDRGLSVRADTAAWNTPSQGVLRRLNFVEVGRRVSLEDGELIEWRRPA